MIQLECPASPFPAPDVVLSSSAQASRAFSDVRIFLFHLFIGKGFGGYEAELFILADNRKP